MARHKISNELWAALEPLIPVFTPSPKGGRRRTVDDRAALNGILYVLQAELVFGSGMTTTGLAGRRLVGATTFGDASPVA